jgi:hypothetical protein
MPALSIRMSSRSDVCLDRTEDLVRPRRALARLLQLEERPAAAL